MTSNHENAEVIAPVSHSVLALQKLAGDEADIMPLEE